MDTKTKLRMKLAAKQQQQTATTVATTAANAAIPVASSNDKKNKKNNSAAGAPAHVTDAQKLVNRPAQLPSLKDMGIKESHYYTEHANNKYVDAPLGVYNWKGPSVKDRLALVMMIKNEEKRIEVSYDTVKSICNTFVILDTGSTDRTVDITRAYCKKNNITLHLAQIPFVNFEKSRNDLLDYADEVLKHNYFMLLLDCNDELRSHSELSRLVESHSGTVTGFHLKQQWWTGHSLDNYFNIRMVISHFGWRYKGVVHEYICRRPGRDAMGHDISKHESIILFQDRTVDDDKTLRRFKRDKDLLHTEHLRNPEDSRTLFYLAQTCNCLNQPQEAYEYNLLRSKYRGFTEEVFHAYLRMGQTAERLNHPWEECLGWYLKAYSHSKRAEPLVAIADHYLEWNAFGAREPDYHLAYMYASEACKLLFPHEQILFIDKNCYIYRRWHVLARCAYYVNRFQEGKEACIKALMAKDDPLDMNNLIFYLKAEKDVPMQFQQDSQLPQFKNMMAVNIEGTKEIVPDNEVGLGYATAFTREDVLKRANKQLQGGR